MKPILSAIRETGAIKAVAHITGGGLIENIPRILPAGIVAEIDLAAWTAPPVFRWLKDASGLDRDEFARTFNCGIGMVVITSSVDAGQVMALLEAAGETPSVIGEVGVGRRCRHRQGPVARPAGVRVMISRPAR